MAAMLRSSGSITALNTIANAPAASRVRTQPAASAKQRSSRHCPFTAAPPARAGRRTGVHTICQANRETACSAAPSVVSEPRLETATTPDDAQQSVSLRLPPLSETDATAEQPSLKGDTVKRVQRAAARQRQQMTYQMSAIAASLGVTSLAVAAVYCRFSWHMDGSDGTFPWADAAATLLLTIGGAIGMELWAQFAHKALWHDFEPGWALHKSHHAPRLGPFEDNDVFAIVNAIPAMSLCAYGFLTPGVVGGLCFGAGLGITLFGISYMFIHDGLVHRRFPVGPIAQVPYLKRVAIAHKLHHSEKYDGVPWGLFLGPLELEKVGGREELDRMVREHNLASGGGGRRN